MTNDVALSLRVQRLSWALCHFSRVCDKVEYGVAMKSQKAKKPGVEEAGGGVVLRALGVCVALLSLRFQSPVFGIASLQSDLSRRVYCSVSGRPRQTKAASKGASWKVFFFTFLQIIFIKKKFIIFHGTVL